MTETHNVQDILNLLKELDQTNSFNVYLPSLQKTGSFKHLNTEQFKRLLKTVIDSPIYNTQFITTVNAIIKENILDESIDVSMLTIFDKLLFLIKTRIECVSPTYNFTFTDEEISNYKLSQTTHTVNLAEHYNTFIQTQPIYLSQEYALTDYNIVCDVPTIETENKLEKELHKNIKIEITTPEELRTTLGDTFINEISKYIRQIKIKDVEVNFDNMPFKNRIKIVEQLPTTIINKVLRFVEGYKKIIQPLTIYKINVDGHIIEKELPLDATLLNG